ncbi:MAG: cysteine desulfurase [Bdellovibrio sp.]|nr:MAG: cysteine desulfurase [Bdellovibrio sp.]
MQEFSKVYLDYNATTPPAVEVKDRLLQELDNLWGNPSSIHWAGRWARSRLRETRFNWARALDVNPLELVFTSGGSESNATVISSLASQRAKGTLPPRLQGRNEIITTAVEHSSLLKALAKASEEDADLVVHHLPVSRGGELDLASFAKLLGPRTLLVSVMMANNETGAIFPLGRIAKKAQEAGALVHTDAVQALGKIPVELNRLHLNYASISAHKFYALKGTGLLYVRKGSPPVGLIPGTQERGRRGGTENLLGIAAFGEMVRAIDRLESEAARMRELRDTFERQVCARIAGVRVTGSAVERLPNTSSLVIDGVDGETLLMSLDLKGFAVSTGAACSSGNPEPSPVLLKMGLSRAEAQSSLRVSLGWMTTGPEVKAFISELERVVHHLRGFSQQEVRA